MVLITTGTNEQGFDRLVAAARGLQGDLLVQYGSASITSGPNGRWVDFLSFDELRAGMLEADVVVCHGGVGSVILACRCGKRPVVMPRRVALGEAVDDHQLPFSRRLHEAGMITLAEDEDEVRCAVARESERIPSQVELAEDPARPSALARELRTVLGRYAKPRA